MCGQAGSAVGDLVGAGMQQGAGLAQVITQGCLAEGVAVRRAVQGAGIVVEEIEESKRMLSGSLAVVPQAGVRTEDIVGEEALAIPGQQCHGVDQVIPQGLGYEVVEVDAGPAGFDSLTTQLDFDTAGAGMLRIDAQEPMPVRAGAGAAAAGLNAKQVIEQGYNEVVVQVTVPARPDTERHDGKSLSIRMAKNFDIRVSLPALQGTPPQSLFTLPDESSANGNYLNQELYGGPTTLPWALRIDSVHRPVDTPTIGLYHPTFLYVRPAAHRLRDPADAGEREKLAEFLDVDEESLDC